MPRRGFGEGSIYRRKDGRWEAIVDLGLVAGRRRRKSVYGKTRHEVQTALAGALKEHEQGRLTVGRGQTTGQFLTHWLEDSARNRVRPSTFKRYSDLVNQHLLPHLDRLPLRELSPQHVQQLLNAKLAEGLSPRSVHHIRAVLRTALNQAVRWQLVVHNAAALAESPRLGQRRFVALTPEQARSLLIAAREDRLEALYTVALALGLRQGEALGLRWQDVDLEHRRLHVLQALQRVDGTLQLVETKTTRSRRTIVLPGAVAEALLRHRTRQLEDRLLAGPHWIDSGFVFTSRRGTPIDGAAVRHSFPRLLARAGLPRMRFHDLRHSCASLLLAQGVAARTVMEVLGHSQIGLTLDTYSHVMPQLVEQAADAMELVLRCEPGSSESSVSG